MTAAADAEDEDATTCDLLERASLLLSIKRARTLRLLLLVVGDNVDGGSSSSSRLRLAMVMVAAA